MVLQAIIDEIKKKLIQLRQNQQILILMMKLVVPNTSAGTVNGKSGASIKEIRESTGATIQIYPKAGSDEAKNSPGHVITVGAETNANLLMSV
uniref:K Homology domain-containing protein n=1 Tax=Panagrolaimus davidi TaxID=227884 RepID=A0A914R620_9BILA